MTQADLKALKNRINELEKENHALRSLLDKAGISYNACINADQLQEIQSKSISQPEITDVMIRRFFSYFWGRTDVYSKRSVNKVTGRAGYYLQCDNFWTQKCPKKYGKKIKCLECNNQKYSELNKSIIRKHLLGEAPDGSDVIGVYPLFPDDTCRFLVYDFDNHTNDADKNDSANTDEVWREEVDAMREICKINSIPALIERSRSGRGAHIWIFFDKPIPAALARKFGSALLNKGAESVNMKSFDYYDRMLPMQDKLPNGGVGNLIALPLQGRALLQGNSAFVDENWIPYENQWSKLFSTPKLSEENIKRYIAEWAPKLISTTDFTDGDQDEEKPWERSAALCDDDVDGLMEIVLSNGIYVSTSNLRPRIQNKIRQMAAFSNPTFYKNMAMGYSNYSQPSKIYLGYDAGIYICIPRGLQEGLIKCCESGNIGYTINDERCSGTEISVSFKGILKEAQKQAVERILANDNGILSASTAFGKTVVCCAIIAERSVNTLVLLQSTTLLEQWENAFDKFLQIGEEPPCYKTPSGRIRKRKKAVGIIHGAQDTSTGIIDIAMAGSLCKNGEYHKRLKEYGMVILDECHHAASDTITGILKETNAKYVYGVTATPMRADGLQKINSMMIGPIRYTFSAKERAQEQGIAHVVFPRFTRAVAPRMNHDSMSVNDSYEIIRNNDDRDDLIISDVVNCIAQKRCPVILSRFKDHSQRLYERLKCCADHVFLLSGDKTRTEQKTILQELKNVPPSESLILVATGKLVGEGFDFPRLDTLIMATPVAARSVVEQYAGRLNRDYDGKESVIIYDYIDSHLRHFDNMYAKRLRAYKQIGYEVGLLSNSADDSAQARNAIYDMDNYGAVFLDDMLNAEKEIVISTPVITHKKVKDTIAQLREKQAREVHVVVVTRAPDCYGYGDGGKWAALHEQMRCAGFDVFTRENFCQRYCIVDRKIVWYGSMNFLGKEDVDDNLMRVESTEIAAELLEMTFGKEMGAAR